MRASSSGWCIPRIRCRCPGVNPFAAAAAAAAAARGAHACALVPLVQAYGSLVRFLAGIDDDARDALRRQVLATTVVDIRTFATALKAAVAAGVIVHGDVSHDHNGLGIVSASVASASAVGAPAAGGGLFTCDADDASEAPPSADDELGGALGSASSLEFTTQAVF
jgi:hypothetical protein